MTDFRQVARGQRVRVWGVVAAVALVAGLGLAWLLGPGAIWVLHLDGVHGLTGKDLIAAVDAVRGRILTVVTGLITLVAIVYTARNAETARRTFYLVEQGHVTERYTKAIDQFGSDKVDIRVGGIYALERIAADSARDHPTVMEVLTAFIREHVSATSTGNTTDAGTTTSEASAPPAPTQSAPTADIQAALTVIGRRTGSQDIRPLDLSGADMSGADLFGVNLCGAKLFRVNLSGANLARSDLTYTLLSRANLSEAHLFGANLSHAGLFLPNLFNAKLSEVSLFHANLIGATLSRVNLSDADLSDADLSGAKLTHAKLTRADLAHVTLCRADLSGADLSGASLGSADLNHAVWTEQTVWPDAYVDPIRAASREIEGGVFRIDADVVVLHRS